MQLGGHSLEGILERPARDVRLCHSLRAEHSLRQRGEEGELRLTSPCRLGKLQLHPAQEELLAILDLNPDRLFHYQPICALACRFQSAQRFPT